MKIADSRPTARLQPGKQHDRDALPWTSVLAEVVHGKNQGLSVLLDQERVYIGRSEQCRLVLTDPAVSELHVEVAGRGHWIHVRDVGSTNGMEVNSVETKEVWAQRECTLVLGSTTLRLSARPEKPLSMPASTDFGNLVGSHPAMRAAIDRLIRIAETDQSLVIVGPSGSGKEEAAREVHARWSVWKDGAAGRKPRPFIVALCSSARGDAMFESELMGHERGAFTHAVEAKPGKLSEATGGTLFLDEIADLSLPMQGALLRVLDRKEYQPIGGKPQTSSCRIIGATWKNLAALVNEGRFRADLYHRLIPPVIKLPALGDRLSDLPLLIHALLQRHCQAHRVTRRLHPDVEAHLLAMHYPGDVRQLSRILDLLVVLSRDLEITPDLLDVCGAGGLDAENLDREERSPAFFGQGSWKSLKQVKTETERAYLSLLKQRVPKRIDQARLAGVDPSYLTDLYAKHGLAGPRQGAPDSDNS